MFWRLKHVHKDTWYEVQLLEEHDHSPAYVIQVWIIDSTVSVQKRP